MREPSCTYNSYSRQYGTCTEEKASARHTRLAFCSVADACLPFFFARNSCFIRFFVMIFLLSLYYCRRWDYVLTDTVTLEVILIWELKRDDEKSNTNRFKIKITRFQQNTLMAFWSRSIVFRAAVFFFTLKIKHVFFFCGSTYSHWRMRNSTYKNFHYL